MKKKILSSIIILVMIVTFCSIPIKAKPDATIKTARSERELARIVNSDDYSGYERFKCLQICQHHFANNFNDGNDSMLYSNDCTRGNI